MEKSTLRGIYSAESTFFISHAAPSRVLADESQTAMLHDICGKEHSCEIYFA